MPHEKTILCFGDSNTYGADAAAGGRFAPAIRYPGALQGMLGGGYRIIEEGMPGRTTVFEDPVAEGMCGLTYLVPCLISHSPLDLLIIMLGTNDCKERFAASPGVVAQGLARLVQTAKNTPCWQGKPTILVVAPVPVNEQYRHKPIWNSLGEGCAAKTAKLAEYYAETARQEGVFFADAGAVAQPHEADWVHLGPQAHHQIALLLQQQVQLILP